MDRRLARFGLLAFLVMADPLPAEEERPRINLLGVRLSAEAAGGADSQLDAGIPLTTCSELEPIPMACAGSAISTDMSSVVLEYDDGMQDGIEDLYVIDVPHAANVTLDLAYANPSADFDLFLMTLGSENKLKVVAASNFHAPGRSERITTPLPPGRYYVGVSAVEGSSTYALSSSALEFSATCTPDATSLCLTPESDYSWFFGASNIEAVVKVLHGCTDPLETVYETITDKEAFATYGSDASRASRRRAVSRPVRPPNCSYTVSPTSQTFTSSAGTGTINVTADAGCDWTASSSAAWLTVTSGRSYGSATLSYSVAANTSTSSRTGTLTVAGKSVSITQSGVPGPCTFTVSPTSPEFPAAGGTGTISVTTRSDCAWTASVSATATWITITAGQSGMGNGSVSYSVAANSSTKSRSGTMTIAGRTVTVSQALDVSLCTYATEYTSKSVTWCGGERSIRVTTQGDCPWTATSNATWLSITLPSRKGTTTLSYAVAPNTTGGSRQAILTVAGTPVTITQGARSSGGMYDGNWSGTTSGNRSVALCVAEGAIQSAMITVVLEFPTFRCTTPLIRQDQLAITGNTFSGTFTTFPEVSNVFTTVRGTFTSASALNGSWDSFSESYFIFCGSTFGFGFGGTILSAGTFTATKQP